MAILLVLIALLPSVSLLQEGASGSRGSTYARNSWAERFLIVAEVVAQRRIPQEGNSPDALELTLKPQFTAAGLFDPTAVTELPVKMYLADEKRLEAAEAEYKKGVTVLALVNLYNKQYYFPTDRVTFMPDQRPILRVKGSLAPEVLEVIERVREGRAEKQEPK